MKKENDTERSKELDEKDVKIEITGSKEENHMIPTEADKAAAYNRVPGDDDKNQLDTEKNLLTETEKNKKNQPDLQEHERNNQKQQTLANDFLENMILDIEEGLLVNEDQFDGLANDEVNKVLKEKIETELKTKQPDHINETLWGICKTETGNIGCNNKESIEKFEKFGLGILIYFKILKMFSILFFCLILINIPLYYVYTVNHPEFKADGFKDMFFKTTIGNIASSLENCEKIPIQNIFNQTELSLSLDCKKYNISSVTVFGMTSNSTYSTENTMNCQKFAKIKEIKTDSNCTFNSYLNNLTIQNCMGKKSCKFSIPTSAIQDNCTSFPRDKYFYFSYNCYDQWISGENVIDRSSFSFVVVSLDVVSIFCFLICLIIIPFSQKSTHKKFKKTNSEISDFTIHFTDLGIEQKEINSELIKFIDHLKKVATYEDSNINLPYDKTKEDLKKNAPDDKTTNEENYGIIYDVNYPILTYDKLKMVSQNNVEIRNNKENKLTLTEIQAKNDEFLNKIKDHETNNLHVNDIYVTFNNIKTKNKIFKQLNKKCYCCINKKIRDNLNFNNKWLSVEEADQPSNVIWPNIPEPKWKIWIFKTISFIIALVVILASFGIVIGNKYAQREIDDKFNSNVDCTFIEYPPEEVIIEFNDNATITINKVKSYCFCLDTLFTTGYTNTKEITLPGTGPLCKDWLEMYFYSQSLMVGTFIFVPVINIFLSIILEELTRFERNKTQSINASSNMWKAFLLQLINTAVVILVVNIYIPIVYEWDPSFPLFTGLFTDFQPLWYKQVGVTIIFYMIINILSPHAQPLLMLLWKKFRKNCVEKKLDKGIKYQRNEYYGILLGPEFNIGLRYAQILTTIFVTLIYSSGMPILYVCCFANLVATYWVDKLLIHILYRYPPKIDYYITNFFNIILFIGVIIHYCFSIWAYSQPELFQQYTNNDSINALSKWIYNLLNFGENSFATELAYRITYSHNIICLIFLIFIVIGFILKLFFMFVLPKYVIFKKLNKEKPKNENNEGKDEEKPKNENYAKTKNIDIYSGKIIYLNNLIAISVKGLYHNYQWRKAYYYKKIKNFEKLENNKELYDYYLTMIENDRKKIIQILEKVYASKSLDGLTVENFDKKFEEYKKNSVNSEDKFMIFIKTLNSENIKDKYAKQGNNNDNQSNKEKVDKHIKIDYSYHIYQIPEFRDAVYYEYCLHYVRDLKKMGK